MDLNLEGHVAIVSGGLSGIGEGIVFRLAREGAIPVILDRADPRADYRARLESVASDFACYRIDLNDTDRIAPIIEEVGRKFGRIDHVVNNAGINDNLALETTSWREFERSLHQNLTHYFEIVHEAVGYLKRAGGSIVNITSKTALTGQGKTSAYAAAKGAILGLTREWAAALAKDGVRTNAIVVAEAWTPMYANWIKTFGDEEAQKDRLAAITTKIPLEKRMTTPEEIANAAAFLLSDCSSHTTGEWFFPDGGYVHLDRALD